MACALSFLVVAVAMTMVSGHRNFFFNNFQPNVKCARTSGQSQFRFFTPYVNRAQLIRDLEAFDKDNNDDITQAELYDMSALGMDLVAGVPRCEFVQIYQARYGLKPSISSPIFTMLDTNNDQVYTAAEVTLPAVDANGDGKTSVCELYNGFMNLVDISTKQFIDRKIEERRIKFSTDFYNVPNSQFNSYMNFGSWF